VWQVAGPVTEGLAGYLEMQGKGIVDVRGDALAFKVFPQLFPVDSSVLQADGVIVL
jgi:hypothetical protein